MSLRNAIYSTNVDKIGDAFWLEGNRFALIQRDSGIGEDANKLVFEIDLSTATNVLDFSDLIDDPTLEQSTAEELGIAGITPVSKKFLFNLPELGYLAGDKPEGLALIPGGKYPTFAVLNDNDFGLLDDSIPGDGLQDFNPDPIPVVVGLITPVPEPSNHTLLVSFGLLGIGSIIRRSIHQIK